MGCSNSGAPAYGEMSWFCCGASWGPCGSAGGGACGNCAWPNTSTGCFDITRPDQCGENLSRRTCGHVFYVTSQCGGGCVSVSIADCGPDTNRFCGERTCCGSACASNRLIDLTPSAYSAIASLSTGLSPVRIDS
jgi:hypothetical protein